MEKLGSAEAGRELDVPSMARLRWVRLRVRLSGGLTAAGWVWGGPLGRGGKSLYDENVVSDCNLPVGFLIGGKLRYSVVCVRCTWGRSAECMCAPPHLPGPASRSSQSPEPSLPAVRLLPLAACLHVVAMRVHTAFPIRPSLSFPHCVCKSLLYIVIREGKLTGSL